MQKRQPYNKPFLSVGDQVNLLSSRGLIIDDRTLAESFLATVNYYRFSGYAIPFLKQGSRDMYREHSHFSDIIRIYKLDQQLRDLFSEATEAIELTFRTIFAYEFCNLRGYDAHMQKNNFLDKVAYKTSVELLNSTVSKSTEPFVIHLRKKYTSIPFWSVTEIMSFGWLARLYGNLDVNSQKPISYKYGIKYDILANYIHHTSVLRNVCAHHSRLYDRQFGITALNEWRKKKLLIANTNPLFYQCVLLYRLLRPTSELCFDRKRWKQRVCNLFDTIPMQYGPFNYRKYAAIPNDSITSPLWVD